MTSGTSPSMVEAEGATNPPSEEEDEHDRPDPAPQPPPPPSAALFADEAALRARLSSLSHQESHDQRRGEGDREDSRGTVAAPGDGGGDDVDDDAGVPNRVPDRVARHRPAPTTVLDCTPRNALNFAQGDWDLVRRDLLLAGVDVGAVDALECEGGPCGTVVAAFRVRRELVHYKKVCLHLFQDGRGDVETRLRRAAAFHYVADPQNEGGIAAGMLAHFEALMMNDDGGVENTVGISEEEYVEDGEEGCGRGQRHIPRSPPALIEQKRLFVACSRALVRHRGANRAVHDARDVAKAICMTPRHPDDDARRPEKLRSLPRSMYVHQACETAEVALSAGCGRRRSSLRGREREGGGRPPSPSASTGGRNQRDPPARSEGTAPESDSDSNGGDVLTPPPPGLAALELAVQRSRDELSWPAGAAAFLRASLVARGGYKALAMAEELASYELHLGELVVRCESLLRRYRDVHESGMAAVVAGGGPVGADDLSAAVIREVHVHTLTGALGICRENTRWISAINDIMRRSVAASSLQNRYKPRQPQRQSRLFVTRDDVPSNRACSFVPRDFAMGSSVAESRRVLDSTLEPAMREAVAREGWPPEEGTRRTRVRTLAAAASSAMMGTMPSTTGAGADSAEGGHGGDGGVKKKKKSRQCHPCRSCGGQFLDAVWVRLGLCAVCEDSQRRAADSGGEGVGVGGCIFACGLPPGSYCPHSRRCFSCDAPHSCETGCRMSRGNGEVAMALVEAMRPRLLLIDFDRTLSSTKSGASPLPTGRRKPRPAKNCAGSACGGGRVIRVQEHTVDDELKAAVLAQQAFGLAHVITRNSHRAEIEEFLSLHGLAELARNVHVVPKKKSKGAFIRECFYSGEASDDGPDEESVKLTEKTCLFIDDDIRELVAEPWLNEETRLHRLLFARILI